MSESIKMYEFRCINAKGVVLFIKASSIYTAMDLAIERLDKLGHLILPVRIVDENGNGYTVRRSTIGSEGITMVFCLKQDEGYFVVQLGRHDRES